MNTDFFLFIWLVVVEAWVIYLISYSEFCPCFTFKVLKTIVVFWDNESLLSNILMSFNRFLILWQLYM